MGISSVFFIFSDLRKKLFQYNILTWLLLNVKVLYCNKINVPIKSNKSKQCMICHYWYFLDDNYKYEPLVCNGCHDVSMMAYELENVAILNIKSID